MAMTHETLDRTATRPHAWKLDGDGEVDLLAHEGFDADGMEHDGPRCTRCGFVYCYWCGLDPEDAECEEPS